MQKVVAAVLAGVLMATAGCSSSPSIATPTAKIAPERIPTVETAAASPTLPPPYVPEMRLQDSVLPGVFADGLDVDWRSVDTSSWVLYENSKYGYSLRYPPAWRLNENDTDGMVRYHGQTAWPVQFVDLVNPPSEWGKDCRSECIPSPPGLLQFNVAITSERCGTVGTRIVLDRFSLAGEIADRCVVLGWNDNEQARITLLAFPYQLGNLNRIPYLVVGLQRGEAVTPAQQAALEAILHSFRRIPQALQTLTSSDP